jgi:predicted acyltransferase
VLKSSSSRWRYASIMQRQPRARWQCVRGRGARPHPIHDIGGISELARREAPVTLLRTHAVLAFKRFELPEGSLQLLRVFVQLQVDEFAQRLVSQRPGPRRRASPLLR